MNEQNLPLSSAFLNSSYTYLKNLENFRFIENNKAAAARCRKATLELENLGKEFRKASIAETK